MKNDKVEILEEDKDILLKEETEEEEEEDKKRRRRILFLLIIMIIMISGLFFLATFGVTYTLFRGDRGENGNEIITDKDKIIFTYSDVDKAGSGIYLKDAVPISDIVGKNLLGTNQYFDFSVTATSKKSKIRYRLLVKKGDDSTITDDNVRIYLTELTGNNESQVLLTTFSNLKQEKIKDTEYYVLYEKTLDKGIKEYSDLYRLRMWLKEDATNYELKKFSLKVDVIAEQVGD